MQKDNSSIHRPAAIVLCGGKSSRMGRPKADLPFGDETMLQRLVRRVAGVVDHVVIVAAKDQVVPDFDNVTLARDDLAFAGPLAGLGVGLDCLGTLAVNYTAAYVTSCDVPFLKPDFVTSLFRQLEEYDVVVPVDEKYHHPLAAVYRTSVAATIHELVSDGERRPRALFDRVRTLRVPTKSLQHVDPQLETLQNINTPGDYQAALIKHGSPVPDWLPALIVNANANANED